jgi:hypothetical protein
MEAPERDTTGSLAAVSHSRLTMDPNRNKDTTKSGFAASAGTINSI